MAKVLGVLLLVGFVLTYWDVIAALGFLTVAVWLAVRVWQERLIARTVKNLEAAQMVARADEQHAMVMAGDFRGYFGDYPPAMYWPQHWFAVANALHPGSGVGVAGG